MLQWFRSRAGWLATTVLWSLVTVGALSAVGHEGECYDDPTAIADARHDSSAHRITAPRVTDRPLHCLLCHWTRAFRADSIRASRVPVVQESLAFRQPPAVERISAAERLQLPPRAPPA